MSQTELTGLVIGGLLPAVLFGVNGVLAKFSTQSGIGIGPYLLVVGLGVAAAGAIFFFVDPTRVISTRGALWSLSMGLTWGLGVGLVAVGFVTYRMPLSKLVPLYNMNTLVAVLLALWIFAEWQHVHVLKLLLGAILVIIGGTLVALA